MQSPLSHGKSNPSPGYSSSSLEHHPDLHLWVSPLTFWVARFVLGLRRLTEKEEGAAHSPKVLVPTPAKGGSLEAGTNIWLFIYLTVYQYSWTVLDEETWSMCLSELFFLGYMPHSGTSGSYGSCMFSFLRNLHTIAALFTIARTWLTAHWLRNR